MESNYTGRQQKAAEEDNYTVGKDRQQGYDMIVFCHLRWQFVYQRPQHIISRMAQTFKILFVEEPLGSENFTDKPAELLVINNNLHVLQPYVDSIEEIDT